MQLFGRGSDFNNSQIGVQVGANYFAADFETRGEIDFQVSKSFNDMVISQDMAIFIDYKGMAVVWVLAL